MFRWLCLFFLVGCTSSPSAHKTKLLLDWWPNPNHIPLYVGLEKGFFQERGIDLEIIPLHDPPDAITYLVTNKADLAVYYFPQTLRAQQRYPQISLAGVLIDQPLQGFLCRDEGKIDKIEDFAGKRIGIPPEGMMSELVKGFPFGEVKHLQFDLSLALYTDSVDIVSGVFWNIEPEQLRARGIASRVFKLSDWGFPPYPELVVLSTERFAAKEAFGQALQTAIDYSKEHPDEAFEIYARHQPDKGKETLAWERIAWEKTGPLLAKSQRVDAEAFIEWMKARELIH